MASDWIKMRGGLFSSPKLIAMARELHASREFREWMTPGGGGEMNGQIVSNHALRCVTGALLCVTWSWSREFGKALHESDCLLPKIGIDDLDDIAGAPAVGGAMARVGWAVASDDPQGVILPNFFAEFNVPLTSAEKQRAYRERKKRNPRVTEALPGGGHKTVTREEKRRVEITESKDSVCARKRFSPPTVDEVAAYCRERANGVDAQAFVDHYEANGWRRGKTPMRDWKAAVRTWEASDRKERGHGRSVSASSGRVHDRPANRHWLYPEDADDAPSGATPPPDDAAGD